MALIGDYNGSSPCRDCADRWVNEEGTCHSVCEIYIEFKKDAVAYNKQAKDERKRDKTGFFMDGKTHTTIKMIERARKK